MLARYWGLLQSSRSGTRSDRCTEHMRIIRKIPPHDEVDDFPLFSDHVGYRGAKLVRIVKPQRRRHSRKMSIWLRDVQTKIFARCQTVTGPMYGRCCSSMRGAASTACLKAVNPIPLTWSAAATIARNLMGSGTMPSPRCGRSDPRPRLKRRNSQSQKHKETWSNTRRTIRSRKPEQRITQAASRRRSVSLNSSSAA